MARAPNSAGWPRASEEAQPRYGVALDGVKRLKQTRVPRARPAPDGRKSGGSQPPDSSRINRRIYWLRLCRCIKVKNQYEDLKTVRAALDIGSHINAGRQPLPKA
jgi:hypothetical protein